MDRGTSGTGDSFESGVPALLESLERLVKVGPLYPADHGRSVAAAEEVLDRIQSLGEGRGLTLGVGDTSLTISARSGSAVREDCEVLRNVLLSLGIGRVVFGPEVNAKDLHALAYHLSSLRRELCSTSGRIRLDGFPPSLRVSAREPGAPSVERRETGFERRPDELLLCFTDSKLSLKELAELRDRSAQETTPPPPDPYDMREWIAVIFDVLKRTPDRFPCAFFSHVDKALRLPLEEPARETLRGALLQMLHGRELSRLDELFPAIAEAMRSSRSYPVAFLLEDLLAEPDTTILSMLWPHLANEYLLGFRAGNQERERGLLLHMKALPQQEFSKGVARLRNLSAVQTRELSKKIFANPGPQLFPLLGALLEGPDMRELGDRVLGNLRSSPLSWPGAEALSVLEGYDATAAEFMRLIFREDARRNASPELQAHAARILTEALSALTEEQLFQPWIPIAIASLGKIGYQPAAAVLRNIERERRHMFRPAWPKALREAARHSLEKLAVAGRKSA